MIDVKLQQEEDIKIKILLLKKLILETNDRKKKGKIKELIFNNKIDVVRLNYLEIEKLLNDYHDKEIPNNNIKNIFDNTKYKVYKTKQKIKQERKHIKLKGINLKKSFKNFFSFRGGSINEDTTKYKTSDEIKDEMNKKIIIKDNLLQEDKWKNM
tara:strand:+ start:166 stop:630 length:465 start_codon:yes stop_codon:yes gene_type:complete